MLFWRKTDKTTWRPLPPFPREPSFQLPPLPLPFLSNFCHDPSFCLNFKNKKPPLILRGGNYRSIAKKVCIYIASNYLFKVNNRNIGEKGLKSSRLTIKTLEQHQWCCSGVLTLDWLKLRFHVFFFIFDRDFHKVLKLNLTHLPSCEITVALF